MARLSRRSRWLIGAAALLAVFAVSVYSLIRDEPPPADGDLRPARRTVAGEANGFFLLDQEEAAEAEEDAPADEVGEGDPEADVSVEEGSLVPTSTAFNQKLAGELLSRNAGLVRRFEECLTRPDFQVPEMRRVFERLPYLHTWRRAVDLVLRRSRLCHEDGRDVEALDDAMQVIRFGRRVENAQGGMIHYLTGLGIREQGVRQLLFLLSRTRARPEELRLLIAECGRLLPDPEALHDVCKQEYRVLSATFPAMDLRELGSGIRGLRIRLLFKPNETRRLLAEDMRTLMAESLKPPALRQADLESRYSSRLAASLNSGRLLLGILVPTYSKALHRRDLGRLHMSAASVLLALKCHSVAHGKLPESLDELVPAYLDAVPRDPFDEKPLRYSREEKTVHSLLTEPESSGVRWKKWKKVLRGSATATTFRIDFE